MRLVHDLVELPAALEGARREAHSAFGDGTLMLEKLIEADAARPGGDTIHRMRVGLYGFDAASAAPPAKIPMPTPAKTRPRKPRP